MKAIFKGETVVRTKLTLDTGLEKLGCSDVSYFVRKPKLTHTASKEECGVITEKDLSFNKILLLKDADEVTINGLTFTLTGVVDYNLDEEYVVFYTDACCSVEDSDKKEKIEAYHKLMEAYERQVDTKEDSGEEDESYCEFCDGDSICAGCIGNEEEPDLDEREFDSDKKEEIKKKAMDDLDELLTAFFGDVPGFEC